MTDEHRINMAVEARDEKLHDAYWGNDGHDDDCDNSDCDGSCMGEPDYEAMTGNKYEDDYGDYDG